jgi:hypothetical protein
MRAAFRYWLGPHFLFRSLRLFSLGMNFSRFALLALAAALGAAPAARLAAQDLQTLDLLVHKGVITQAEADQVAKSAAIIVTPRVDAVKKLKISGLIQIQFDYLSTKDNAPGAIPPPVDSQFLVRRAQLTVLSDLGNGWTGELGFNFAAGAQRSAPPEFKPTQANFRRAIISKTFDGVGTATAGYQKVTWGQEEGTSASKLKTVERSIMTTFFDGPYRGTVNGRLGFGGHHVGLYWNGTVSGWNGFYYGAAVVNGIQSVMSFGGVNRGRAAFNQFGYWANAGYSGVYAGVGYRVGINAAYSQDANSTSGAVGVPGQNNAMYGYNPYVTVIWGNLTVAGEFMQTVVQNGRVDAAGITSSAAPYGFLISPSYAFTQEWELATRFTYLSTNGRGTEISPVMRDSQNTYGTRGYDDAWAVYLGFNYYIIGTTVELSAGYEYAEFYHREAVAGGTFMGPSASVDSIRVQMQLVF